MTDLRLIEVVREYDKGTRVGPVSFAISQGSFVSLLGPSGCGKTTILRCIAGFERVDQGRILIGSEDISRKPPHRRGVGLVFQSYALFPHLSVFDNVAFGLRLRKLSSSETSRRVHEALDIVSLRQVERRLPGELSGGQQQRVAIARSVVLQPAIMLLDEPLSNLDFKLRVQMRTELRALQQRLGMTFVYVTHDQTEALALSDRILVLSNGQIVQEGTPQQIYGKPRTRFVADFIGASNLLEATVAEACGSGLVRVMFEHGSEALVASHRPAEVGARVCVSIRPENLKLASGSPEGAGGARNVLTGKPISMTFTGDRTEVTLDVGASSALPTEPGQGAATIVFYVDDPASVGERVQLHFDPASAVIVS
jgi:spermidine/putrescine ABC transporter ATP-binding subunit